MAIHRSARKNFYVMWHNGSIGQNILFYMHPFLQDLIFVWSDVWGINLLASPLPTIYKAVLSVIIMSVMLLPLVLCVSGMMFYLGFWQYQIESLYPGLFPDNMKIYQLCKKVFGRTKLSEEVAEEWNRKLYQGVLLLIGIIDYFRILLEFM